MKTAIMTAAVIGVIYGAPHAWAAMTVFDPTAQSSRLQQLNNAVKQLEEAQARLAELERQTAILGTRGSLPMANASADLVRRSARFGCSMVNFAGWNVSPDFQIPDVSSLCALKNFLNETVVPVPDEETGNYSPSNIATVRRRRVEAVENAAVNGYAHGLSERESAGDAMTDLGQLAGQAAATTTLREDMALNNRLAIRQIEELIAIRSTLGALVEVQSAQTLQQAPMVSKASGEPSGLIPTAGTGGSDPFDAIQ